jgi:hypothetical protein
MTPMPACMALSPLLIRPRESAEKFASRQCLGWRVPQGPDGKVLGPYTFMTYKEAWDRAVQVRGAEGLKSRMLDIT